MCAQKEATTAEHKHWLSIPHKSIIVLFGAVHADPPPSKCRCFSRSIPSTKFKIQPHSFHPFSIPTFCCCNSLKIHREMQRNIVNIGKMGSEKHHKRGREMADDAQKRRERQSQPDKMTPSGSGTDGAALSSSSARSAPTRPARPPLFAYPALPRREMALCWTITLTALCYAWFCVWSASQKWEFRMGQPARIQQLPFVGARFKDESNWEWFRWSPFALHYLPFLLLHCLLFNLLPLCFSDSMWPLLYVSASVAISAHIFSPWLLFCALFQGFFIFACTFLFRRTIAVWLSALPLLYVVMNRTDWVADDPFLVLLFVSYTLLSFVSFCLELSRQLTTQSADRSPTLHQHNISHLIIRMLLYTFYQPYLFSLIVLYPDFERQLALRHVNRMPFGTLLFKAVRLAFWWLICELCLCFFYFGIIALDAKFLAQLPKNEFVCIGMAMGAFFHLKYVVIFGLPALFAHLDGMRPPAGPICISRVALYSKIWRGFDRGLYTFFKEYIFIPICRPTFSLFRKILGIVVSFTFVLLWHGFFPHNIVWIGLNIAEMLIEFGAKSFYAIPSVRQFRLRTLSDLAFRRLLGFLQIVPFAFGLYSNFYFLGGRSVGWLFVLRIFLEETITVRWPFLLLITLGYFYMQVTMEIERRAAGEDNGTAKATESNGCPMIWPQGWTMEENGTTRDRKKKQSEREEEKGDGKEKK